MQGIFTTITTAFLERLNKELVPLAAPIVAATIDMYAKTCETLRPTPAKPHYTFNLRDVSKVVQGVLMADSKRVSAREELVRLWTHECARVFADRLINDEDRAWFLEETKGAVKKHFSMDYKVSQHGCDPPIGLDAGQGALRCFVYPSRVVALIVTCSLTGGGSQQGAAAVLPLLYCWRRPAYL